MASPSGSGILTSVAASSASNVWAVGELSDGGPPQVLAIHCC